MKTPANHWLILKHSIAQALGVNSETVDESAKPEFGDFSFPCFNIAKAEKRNPKEVAEVAAGEMKAIPEISEVKALGPYVNFFIDWNRFGTRVLKDFHANFGGGFEKGKILIEHTSINPNASPHVGRARNAIIGDSLTQILRFAGKKVETHYFVNDVGKQIALLVWAAGGNKNLKFGEVLSLYIEANKKMEADKAVEKEVFELLANFESGDKKTIAQFKKIVKLCVEGQKKILKELGVEYDSFDFESEWLGKKTNDILKKLEKTGKLFTDKDNRKVLDLKGTEGLGESTFFVVTRADGTSLYSLRDLAYSSWKAEKAGKGLNILVLGEDQKLYFQQLSAALKSIGVEPPKVLHYSFVLLPGGGKMSTRQGNVVLLEDFMKEVYAKASEEIKKRWPEISEKEMQARARKIGNAAVRYGMLKVSPEKNVLFNLEEAVRFEGDTGPYLLYTYARANSILEKAGKWKDSEFYEFRKPEEKNLMKKIAQFPSVVEKASEDLRPHLVATFAGELAEAFNKFYEACPVLAAENNLRKISRLKLVWSAKIVLRNCAKIIGMEVLEKM